MNPPVHEPDKFDNIDTEDGRRLPDEPLDLQR
jgi:hypothetical protein